MSKLVSTNGFHGSAMLPWFTCITVAVAAILFVGFGPAPADLLLDRQAVASGELWRLLTGHFVHADGEHFLWDVSALALLGVMVERMAGLSARRLACVSFLGIAVINAALWFGMPYIGMYCGLSAVLNTIFAYLLLHFMQQQRGVLFPFLFIGGIAKIIFEWQMGDGLLAVGSWPSLPPLHAAGYGAGVLAYVVCGHTLSGHSLRSLRRVWEASISKRNLLLHELTIAVGRVQLTAQL